MTRYQNAIAGLRAGVPIAVGYLPIGVTFGLVGTSAGLTAMETLCLSLLVFAGASQFVAVNLMALGASTGEIVLTTLVLNIRNFLMTSTLSRRMEPETGKGIAALVALGITDETFSVASLRDEGPISPSFCLSLNIVAYLAWCGGTAAGALVASAMPSVIRNSMGIALYAMFITLLVPRIRVDRHALIVALTAMGLHLLFRLSPLRTLGTGWGIVAATVGAASVGAWRRASDTTGSAP
ncbi:MAG: branched-chain amino acid ABC transporter permease [Dethiosulfovibrio peptidovorans]|nr:MAG: branched-chain amino acid ABC transporter permease [Dethiosulfovibrio peptidovorans]